MELTKTLKEYIEQLSSNSPTPGGGNVAAFCGVLASALGTMVCNLTLGKKKYSDVEQRITELKSKLENLKEQFVSLAQKDNEAFDKVMAAFKLPKETDEQKEKRKLEIDNATFEAAVIPSHVINACKNTLPVLKEISEIGNQNSLSDCGVGISLLNTATEGAFLNVLINCSSLSNQTIAQEFLKKAEINYNEVKAQVNSILSYIISKMRNQ